MQTEGSAHLRQNGWFSALQSLSYLTQVGLSVAAPIVLCILGAWWLNDRCGVGEWVFLPAFVLGIGGGVASFVKFAQYFARKNKNKHNNENK